MPTGENEVKDIIGLREDLQALGNELKGILDTQEKELKKHGKTTLETGADLRKANERWEAIHREMNDLQAELKQRVDDVEKSFNRGNALGMGADGERKSIGELLITSDQFKNRKGPLVDAISFQKRDVFVPGAPHFNAPSMKELAGTSADMGALLDTYRWNQVIQIPQRPTRIADLIPVVGVNTLNIEYPEEVATHKLYAELEAQADAAQDEAVIERTVEGFFIGQTVTLSPGLAQEEDAEILDIDYDTRTLTFTAVLTNTHPAGRAVVADQFVYTPETKIKPAAKIEFELREIAVKTLATLLPVSKQMADDATGLMNYINARLGEFAELSKEEQLLYGDNTTRQIQGIMTHPDILHYLWSNGVYGDTKLDAIRRAATLAMLAHLPPDSVTIHTSDWTDIELLKGDDGHYLFLQIPTGNAPTTVWRLRVVETTVIEELHALVGSYSMGAVQWVRGDAEISMSDQNRDWWEKNIVGVRLEERMNQSVIRPKSFVDTEFDDPPPSP